MTILHQQNETRKIHDNLFTLQARIGKAVASPKRMEILMVLSHSPRTVESIARECELTVANTSQHLQVLRSNWLVQSEKNGLFVTYRLCDSKVAGFVEQLCSFAYERSPEVSMCTNKLQATTARFDSIAPQELYKDIKEKYQITIDVRSNEEYRYGHIPDAASMPSTNMHERINELPSARLIVVYSRNSDCILATEAAAILENYGHRVLILAGGIASWKANQLPLMESVSNLNCAANKN